MNRIATYIFIMSIFASTLLMAQVPVTGDYQTRDSGNWSNAQVWQTYNGAAWVNVATAPTGSETITVLAADSVFVDAAVSISGTLVNQGIVEDNDLLTIADGGTYQHDRDEGRVPLATWAVGSTMLVTGVTATAPNDRDQDYYNLTFNTPGLTNRLHMNLDSNTIGGDIRVIDTAAKRWYLTSASTDGDSCLVTIIGNVYVENGEFSVQGSSKMNTKYTVHHYGNIEVTGGNFSIARGSQSGLGTTTWFMHEGNFSIANAKTQNSNAMPDGAKFIFMKDGTQILTIGENVDMSALPIQVNGGTTLDMGASAMSGGGNFTVQKWAGIKTTLAGGINEIFASMGDGIVTLEDDSNYEFNGSSAQITGTLMPATVSSLTINNTAGVTLSQATTINGMLHLVAGVFDNTIPFTLGPNGSVSEEGGSLLVPTAVERQETNIPTSFAMYQNYPNPFNPTTTIRFDVPERAKVVVKVFDLMGREVVELVNEPFAAGAYSVTWDARGYASGVYYYQINAGNFISVKKLVLMK